MANVLILEDDYPLAKIWREALIESGHTATLAFTSSEAISHVENEKFDAYIIDLKIEIDIKSITDSGVKFLSYLHRIMTPAQIEGRVIGVSGLVIDSDPRQSRHAFEMFDVKHFLPKPFDPSLLVTIIEEQVPDVA